MLLKSEAEMLFSFGKNSRAAKNSKQLKRHSLFLGRADLDASFLTLKKVDLNKKSKSLVEFITKSASIRELLCSIFDHCLKNLFLSVLFLIVSYYFFHIWSKTLWIASPKEHEKKRWNTGGPLYVFVFTTRIYEGHK